MSISRNGLIPVGIALISALTGFFLYREFGPERLGEPPGRETARSAASVIGQPVPAVQLPDPMGEIQTLSQWRGRPMLINFWATWCPPCREEIPDLIALRHAFGERGLVVVGIALDDPKPVRRFVRDFHIDYPVLVEEGSGTQMNTDFGNALGVLPYTVYVDADGVIRKVHRGALTRDQGRKDIRDLFDF